LFTHRFL
jgi:hypothetical protein